MLEILVFLLCGSILASGFLAIRLPNVVTSIVSAGLASLFAAVSYILLAAPDVAMAEASIGSVSQQLSFSTPAEKPGMERNKRG